MGFVLRARVTRVDTRGYFEENFIELEPQLLQVKHFRERDIDVTTCHSVQKNFDVAWKQSSIVKDLLRFPDATQKELHYIPKVFTSKQF